MSQSGVEEKPGSADRPDKHLAQLDGLRGLAALVVVIGHSANDGFLPQVLGHGTGQMGVVMFFALSAFLMSHLYGAKPFTRSEVGQYALNRTGRVLPLYFAVVLISWALWRSAPVWLFQIDEQNLMRHLLLISADKTLWTIPVEVQFYVVFLLIWRLRSPWAVLGVMLVGGGIGLALRSASPLKLPLWIFPFVAGLAIHRFWKPHRAALETFADRWGVGLGLLALGVWVLAMPSIREGWLPVLPNWIDPLTLGAPVLVFACGLIRAGPFRLLELRPLRWLGEISYGFYVFHYPVVETVKRYAPNLGFVGFVIILVISLGAAWLSYTVFERPVRRAISRLGAKAKPNTGLEAAAGI